MQIQSKCGGQLNDLEDILQAVQPAWQSSSNLTSTLTLSASLRGADLLESCQQQIHLLTGWAAVSLVSSCARRNACPYPDIYYAVQM